MNERKNFNLVFQEKKRFADLVFLLNKIDRQVKSSAVYAAVEDRAKKPTQSVFAKAQSILSSVEGADRQQKEKTYPKFLTSLRTGKLFCKPVLILSNILEFLINSFIFRPIQI